MKHIPTLHIHIFRPKPSLFLRTMSSRTLDPNAISGFSGASAYDAHRPSYVKPAVEHLLTQLHVSGVSHARILDLAAGTGKFTELLAGRPEHFQIAAVEPHSSMLTALKAKRLPGVQVLEGNAEAVPLPDGWADAAVVAQVIFPTPRGCACAEGELLFATPQTLAAIARTLKPGAKLGLIWNVEDYNQAREYPTRTRWESALRTINWKYTTDVSPRYKNSAWAAAFTDQTVFSPLEEKVFEVKIWLEKEALWKRLGTLSNIANLSDGEKDDLREDFDEVLEEADDLERNGKGEIAVHYIVHNAWATKL